MPLRKHRTKTPEDDLKLIVAQGEAILARLELIDQKLEYRKEELRRQEEDDGQVD